MKLAPQSPQKALKAFLKQKPLRREIDTFKANLINLLAKIAIVEEQPKDESEEHLKNNIRDFLRDTYYRETNAINTKDKKDLVIHLDKRTDSKVGVIIEAKRPTNTHEMITNASLNKKAFHELVFYYLNERVQANNNELKQLIITNVYEWYIIDANYFDKFIYRNTQIKKLYDVKINDGKDNPFFYEEVAKIISTIDSEIPCVYFNIKEYEEALRNNKKDDDRNLIALYKILSPQHLLKIASPNDNNSLDAGFYKELLHIIGLEEVKEGPKNIIRRKKDNRNPTSLIELTIDALNTEDVFHRVPDIQNYGDDKVIRTFNIALELCITWINRILFLKLLEGQLIVYHKSEANSDASSFRFLNYKTIHDFDELFNLFHKVLAVNIPDRTAALHNKYRNIPYLNSSLFDISELEHQTIKINSLDNDGELAFSESSVLKSSKDKINKLPILDYLFRFLNAYDFASEGTADIQEDKKTIINASVLGKVFEKINGYKDGSIFTPASITMYICHQTIQLAVVERFNEALSGKDKKLFDKFDDVKNYTSRLFKTGEVLQANEIINSIRICDPAVGSGHFLVSALNEIIAIKAELGIFADGNGNVLANYEIEIINDELIITDLRGNLVEYRIEAGKPVSKEMQRLQKTLFYEKQTIIENCLFGVDINQKSVLICRLRLWIELLKNAYYKEPDYTELETLPNIDINIKYGNSLLSRFSLEADLSKALKGRYDIQAYRKVVSDYKNEKSRDAKRELTKIIDSIKSDFRTEISKNDPKLIKKNKLSGELFTLQNQTQMFELSAKEKKAKKDKEKQLETTIINIDKEIEAIKTNATYKNAFEWRFEFPEVLNNNGDFEGFHVIIGNPPYIQLQKLNENIKAALQQQEFETFAKTGDIYQLFYEQGTRLLKKNGYLGYITSNKWMRTDYGGVTREYLSANYNTFLVVDFGMVQMFESATTYTNILLLSKTSAIDTIKMCRIKDDYNDAVLLEDYIDFAGIEMPNPGEKSWIAYDKKEYELIQKIVRQGKQLQDWDVRITYGFRTGYNPAFIIDEQTKNRIIESDIKSKDLLKPILRGEDIFPWIPKHANLWLVLAKKGYAEDIKNNYKGIYEHLSNYEIPLKARAQVVNGSHHWIELDNSPTDQYVEVFENPKIIYPNMTKFLPFVYDKHQFFTNDKSFIMTGNHLEYLTAFFNSKLFKFAFKDYFPELLGDTRELRKVFFETVTVRAPVNEDWFKEKLDNILENKRDKLSTVSLEMEIDNMFFDYYELTTVERSIILGIVDVAGFSEASIKKTSFAESE